jgi:hypothetical protein
MDRWSDDRIDDLARLVYDNDRLLDQIRGETSDLAHELMDHARIIQAEKVAATEKRRSRIAITIAAITGTGSWLAVAINILHTHH